MQIWEARVAELSIQVAMAHTLGSCSMRINDSLGHDSEAEATDAKSFLSKQVWGMFVMVFLV